MMMGSFEHDGDDDDVDVDVDDDDDDDDDDGDAGGGDGDDDDDDDGGDGGDDEMTDNAGATPGYCALVSHSVGRGIIRVATSAEKPEVTRSPFAVNR